MDILGLIQTLMTDGTISDMTTNPQAQFGRRNRRYLGAELLPEQLREENAYRETGIEYQTVVANDGTRYSPVQIKGGARVGSMLVELGEIDIGSEFKADAYDALIRMLGRGRDMEAMVMFTDWLDRTVNLALREKMELQRWMAIDDANVLRATDNADLESVPYSNPAGHRITVPSGTVAAPDGWYDPTHDPFVDIYRQADLLRDKGYMVSRIVTSQRIVSILGAHPKVQARSARITVVGAGNLNVVSGRASLAQINEMMREDGLPPIETYDLQTRTSTGVRRFKRNTAFAMLATTGRDTTIDRGDEEPILLSNTLGYQGVGRAVGQPASGVVIRMEHKEDKPPRIEAEGWATTLPVILNPEAVAVINVPERA